MNEAALEGLIVEAERWLAPHRLDLRKDVPAYLNHVRRVLAFYQLLCEKQGLKADPATAVAAAWHDLGIWTLRTFDYLEPSRAGLVKALTAAGKPELIEAASAMVLWHHKITPVDPHLPYGAELFRRADWIDLTGGVFRFGLRGSQVKAVRRRFPNHGFHVRLLQLFLWQLLLKPWKLLPMLRW